MSQYPASASTSAKPADGLAIASMICGLMSKTKGGIRTTGIVCSSIAIGLCVLAIVIVVLVLVVGVGAAAAGAGAGAGGGTSP